MERSIILSSMWQRKIFSAQTTASSTCFTCLEWGSLSPVMVITIILTLLFIFAGAL